MLEYPRQLERNGSVAAVRKMVRRRYTGGAGDNARHRPSMPPHVCPRQGRRRPSPSFCAADAGGVATAENYGARRDNARHRPKHAPTRLPPAGPPEALAEFCAAGAGGVATAETCGGAPAAEPRDSHGRGDSNDAIPPKVYRGEGYFATCADNSCIIYSVPRAHLPSCPSPAATAFELLREGTEALPASAKCNGRLREAASSVE